MNFQDFFTSTPQIGAAIITAIFGIIGIFVNIWINIMFRNKDYKNKNRLHNIEILESFYLPLNTHFTELKYVLKSFTDCNNMDETISKHGDAQNDKHRTTLKKLSAQIIEHISKNKNQFIDDYKLYLLQTKIIEVVSIINNSYDNNFLEHVSISKLVLEIENYNKRLEHIKIKLFSKNLLDNIINNFRKKHI